MSISTNVAESLTINYENLQKGIQDVMGGKLIEYEAKIILEQGREEGRKEGREEGIRTLISTLRELSISNEEIEVHLISKFNLSKEDAKKYLKK